MKLNDMKSCCVPSGKIIGALTLLGIGALGGFYGKTLITKVIPKISSAQQVFEVQNTLQNNTKSSAFSAYLNALSKIPSLTTLLYGLARTCEQTHNYELMASVLDVAQLLNARSTHLMLSRAEAYLRLGNLKKAQKLLHSLAATHAEIPAQLLRQTSRIFAEAGLLQEALFYAEKAAAAEPNNPLALANVGNMYNRLGDLEKAVTYYKKALQHNPTIPNILYNLGYTLKRQGKLQESLAYFDRAIALKPGYLDALLDRAYTYWALGDFERAWQDYAWRFSAYKNDPTKTLPMPLWDGRDLSGKTILLYAEQGLGDTLQFIRFTHLVKKRGNPRIICKVQKPLLTLLHGYPSVDNFVTEYVTKGVDYQAPLMSLPGILNLTPTTIPAPHSYLRADKKLVTQWQKKLGATDTLRVGLCWHVDPIHEKDKSPVSLRSVPLTDFLSLGNLGHLTFYALQQGKGLEEINTLPESFPLVAFDPSFDKRHGSFMDSAAVIENLDLVITVDTAIAHLAGALGKEVWILLPFSPDGRWSHTTDKTPWYPTATLFRQTTQGSWQQPLNTMKKLLQQRIAEKRKS